MSKKVFDKIAEDLRGTIKGVPSFFVDDALLCSQGGIPYNKAHLDARDQEIIRLRSLADDMGRTNIEDQKEIERLRAHISQLEQALSQVGDAIELAEAEQRGYLRALEEKT